MHLGDLTRFEPRRHDILKFQIFCLPKITKITKKKSKMGFEYEFRNTFIATTRATII